MCSKLSNDNRLASAILETIGAVVCVMNMEGKIVLFNQACQSLTGYTEKEVLNRYPWELFILPEEVERVKEVFKHLMLGHFPNNHVNYWLTRSGEKRLISWSNTALGDESGNLAYVIATGIDITEQRAAENQVAQQQKNLENLVAHRTAELHEANQKLEMLAYQDALTGLYNRRYFNNALENEIHRARRNRNPLSLLICDVDHFKNYNDHYGHVAGDKCLQQISMVLARHFQRASDLIARYGGEEFCVILPGVQANEAQLLSEQLRQAVFQEKLEHKASPIADRITISIGIVTCIVDEDFSAEVLIREADKALYKAKNDGRNRVVAAVLGSKK